MSHIFISYSRRDLDFAQKIVDALAENNLDTWIDWKSIPKGEDWEQEIYRGIEEADAFLFLISPDSVASEMCNKEINHAVNNGKRILPIVLRQADLKIINPEISKRNWIFCRDGQDDFNNAIEETRKTIHTDYEWLKYHTELQVKARTWEQKKDTSRLLRGKELREAEERVAGTSSQKDPQPTELHRNYILASQRNEVRQRRQFTIGLGIGLIIVAVLAVFAWTQRNDAQRQEIIARLGELATKASLVQKEDPMLLERSMLLAMEAKIQGQKVRLQPLQANQVLQQGLNLLAHMTIQTKVTASDFPDHTQSAFTFSSDNNYAIVADGYIRSIQLATNKEFIPFNYEQSWRAVSFSADGRYAATVSENNLIQIWDLNSGQELSQIAYDQDLYHIYFGAGRKYLVAETPIGSQIWELSSNGEYVPLDQLPSSSAFLSWDGKYLIDELTDEVRVWSMPNGKEISHLKLVREGGLYNLDISSGSKYIITYYLFGQTAQVWQLADGKEIMRVTMKAGESTTPFVFSPDERYLAVISDDQIARVWEIQSGKEVLRLNISPVVNAPAFGVVRFYSLAFSHDGQYLAVSGDNLVRVYSVPEGEEIKRIVYEEYETSVRNPIFSSDGRYLALVSQAGISNPFLNIWEIRNSSNVDSVEGWVNFINMSSNGKYTAVDIATDLDQKTILQINNTNTKHEILKIEKPSDDLLFSLFSPGNMQIISPNGLYGAIRRDKNTIQIFELENGQQIAKIVTNKSFNSYYVFSPDNRYLITVEDEDFSHLLRTWDIHTGNLINSVSKLINTYNILLSPDGNHYLAYLYSDLESSYLSLGTINKDKEVTRINLERDFQLQDILFSPDGNLIAGIGYFQFKAADTASSRYIKVWDAIGGKAIVTLTLERNIRGIALSRDGKYLAASLIDGTYRVWEIDTLSEIIRNPNNGTNFFITFTSDSRYLAAIESIHDSASNSYQSVINLLPLKPENEVCNYLNRNLTEEEWNQYLYWKPYDPEYKTCPNLPTSTK